MLKELARGVCGVFRPVVVLLRYLFKAIAWLFSDEAFQASKAITALSLLAYLAFLGFAVISAKIQAALS